MATRAGVYHLLDAVKTLPVETEGLFEQDFVLHRPLIWKRGEVGQVGQRLFNVVFVPKEHAQSLTHTKRHTTSLTTTCAASV